MSELVMSGTREQVLDALSDLDREIYYTESLDAFLVGLDVLASALAVSSGVECSDPTELFEMLGEHGLNQETPGLARQIIEIASLTLYDATPYCEEKLEEAESIRTDLFTKLRTFLDSANWEGG